MTNFDKTVNRRNTDSLKWNVDEGELPMWVADMDFPTAPCVTEAVVAKAKRGVFGYEEVPARWFDAYVNWWKTRHGWEMNKNWLCFVTGVVPAITSCVKSLSKEGDGVCVMTPVYDIFFHSIENTGRKVVESLLEYDGRTYRIDFDNLERLLALPNVSLLILCNPHNPVGRVWSKEELARVGELCARHGVTVISDEIHCDLTEPDADYVPFASASPVCAEISVTAISASKAFNLAGMQSAAVAVPDEKLREKVVRHLNYDEVAEPNSFACVATVAAFTEGEQWLEELRAYLSENRKTVLRFLSEQLPQLKAVEQQATYLLWVDCSAITDDSQSLCNHIRHQTGLYLNCGAKYRGNGNSFVRINVACPRATLNDGLQRLRKGILSFVPTKREAVGWT